VHHGSGLCKHRRTQSEKSGNGEEGDGSFKETDVEPPVCMFSEALLSLEVVSQDILVLIPDQHCQSGKK
jgi:hypothetical protein